MCGVTVKNFLRHVSFVCVLNFQGGLFQFRRKGHTSDSWGDWPYTNTAHSPLKITSIFFTKDPRPFSCYLSGSLCSLVQFLPSMGFHKSTVWHIYLARLWYELRLPFWKSSLASAGSAVAITSHTLLVLMVYHFLLFSDAGEQFLLYLTHFS